MHLNVLNLQAGKSYKMYKSFNIIESYFVKNSAGISKQFIYR